ncbi:MAG: hypothetical protein R2762_20455, partial [Bryobacteraceae bacterium]
MKLQQHLRATLIVAGLGLLAGACTKKQADSGHQEQAPRTTAKQSGEKEAPPSGEKQSGEKVSGEEAPQTVVLTTPSVMSVPTTQAYVCRLQSRRHIEIRALNE